MVGFISGMMVAGYLVAALFFLRFYRETRDRLFWAFSIAFAMLAAQRAALAILPPTDRNEVLIYGLRLLAFILILAAILDKNRKNG